MTEAAADTAAKAGETTAKAVAATAEQITKIGGEVKDIIFRGAEEISVGAKQFGSHASQVLKATAKAARGAEGIDMLSKARLAIQGNPEVAIGAAIIGGAIAAKLLSGGSKEREV